MSLSFKEDARSRGGSAEAIKWTRAAIPGGYYAIDGTNPLFILSSEETEDPGVLKHILEWLSTGCPILRGPSTYGMYVQCLSAMATLSRVLMFCRYSRDTRKKSTEHPRSAHVYHICIGFHSFPRFMLSPLDVRLGPTIDAYLHSYGPLKLNISSVECINEGDVMKCKCKKDALLMWYLPWCYLNISWIYKHYFKLRVISTRNHLNRTWFLIWHLFPFVWKTSNRFLSLFQLRNRCEVFSRLSINRASI